MKFWLVRSYEDPDKIFYLFRDDGSEVRLELRRNKKKELYLWSNRPITVQEKIEFNALFVK